MIPLSVTIITYNEERNIGRCLKSMQGIADEILVVDSFSTDRTVEICESFGCRVIAREFKGFVDQKQFAVDQAKNDWILSFDADEEITEGFRNELKELLGRDKMPCDGYNIRFSLFYLGRILKHSGVGFEHKLRLFDRRKSAFQFSHVHEVVRVSGSVGRLKGISIHYSYDNLHHHIEKSNRYSTLAAQDNHSRGKHFFRGWAAVKSLYTFIAYYFFKGGFLDGFPGFMWSYLAAFYKMIKIAKTIEMSGKNNPD
jgi:glycosyltransferase involved in cell wall biosynthesis